MSATTTPQAAPTPAQAADDPSPPGAPPATEPTAPCPLCGAPLGATQQWCLRCGAAARTRLAAIPAWRAPLIALAIVIVAALGALTAALVSLAGQ